MTTSPKRHPLRGAWAKYNQAVEHSERYEALLKDFIANNSFAIMGPAQPGEDTATLGPDDVWPELSCAMGDAIHNLRSALDHIAYAVALDRLPEEKIGRLYFTIRPTLGKFKKAFREEPLSIMGADWEAFVLSVQPFQGAPHTALARISELDNIDKHCLMFSLTPRSDVHSRRPDGQWEDESLDLSDGLVHLPTHDTAFVIASHYISLPATGSTKEKARPVERDFLDFYCVVGDIIRKASVEFFAKAEQNER